MEDKGRETRIEKRANESYDKFMKVAGVDLDEVTIVLRCHLLAEYYMDHIIVSRFPRGDLLIERRFSFMQKFQIIEALDILVKEDLDSIKNLNSVRNNCAHSLDYKISEEDVDRIGRPYGKKYLRMKDEHSKSLKVLLHWTLSEPIMALVAASVD